MSAENEPAITFNFSPDSPSFLAGALATLAFYRRHERRGYRDGPSLRGHRVALLFSRRRKKHWIMSWYYIHAT
jgi:hypothetical protein